MPEISLDILCLSPGLLNYVHSSKTEGRKIAKIEWNLQVSEVGRVDTGMVGVASVYGGVVDGGMNQCRVV